MFLRAQDLSQRRAEISSPKRAADMTGMQGNLVKQVGHGRRVDGENGVDGVGRDRLDGMAPQKKSTVEQDLDLARNHIVADEVRGFAVEEIIKRRAQRQAA